MIAAADPTRGRAIVANRQVGLCVLCHAGPFPEVAFQGNIGPDLHGVGARLTEAELRAQVTNAKALNPASVMPSYAATDQRRVAGPFQNRPILSPDQIEDVVAYLATLRAP